MKKQIFGYVTALVGFLLLAGAAGSSDYYYECLAAADCVAGEQPSLIWEFIQAFVGLTLLIFGVVNLKEEG
jgi:hypothetical protein